MEKLVILAVIAAVVSGCQKIVPAQEMERRDGVAYRKGEATPFTGVTHQLHTNGQVGAERRYRNGKRQGEAKWHYPNGQIQQRITYVDDVAQGTLEQWYDSGGKEAGIPVVNGRAHGIVTLYYKNGNKSEETTYVDGFPRGLRKQYREDGTVLQQYDILQGGEEMKFK